MERIAIKNQKELIFGFLIAFILSGFLFFLFPYYIRLEPNLWFGADIERVIRNMVDPLSNLYRLKVHPLFSLVILPVTRPIFWLAKSLGLESDIAMVIAAQVVVSISAGIVWVLIYCIAIKIGLSRVVSFGVGLLFLSTSTFQVWWSTPETYPLGALTILLPFLLLAFDINSRKAWLTTLVGTLSITTTNWIAGLIASFTRFGPKKKFRELTLNTFIVFIILICVQKSYFPTAGLPFQLGEEVNYIKKTTRSFETFYQFFVAPVVPVSMPKIVRDGEYHEYPQLEFHLPSWRDVSLIRVALALCWLLLLMNGIFLALSRSGDSLGLALVVFVAFEFILHSIYGDTPYLYSAHYVPILVLLAGKGLTGWEKNKRRYMIAFVYVLAFSLLILNLTYLGKVFELGSLYLATKF